MRSYRQAIAVALATFVASLLGMALRLVLPVQVLNDSKSTVGGMTGLITLLLALVLGLLVYTAFTVYSTQQSEAQGLGPVVIELDDLLEQYGPDALRGRVGLREALGRSRKRFFGDPERGPQAHTFEETRATMHWMNTYFGSLEPATERQRQLRVSAKDLAKTFAETQMLMAGNWPILSPSTCSSSSPSGPPCCFSATASSRRRTRLRSRRISWVPLRSPARSF